MRSVLGILHTIFIHTRILPQKLVLYILLSYHLFYTGFDQKSSRVFMFPFLVTTETAAMQMGCFCSCINHRRLKVCSGGDLVESVFPRNSFLMTANRKVPSTIRAQGFCWVPYCFMSASPFNEFQMTNPKAWIFPLSLLLGEKQYPSLPLTALTVPVNAADKEQI